MIRIELLTPHGQFRLVGHLQQALHHARRGDGLLLPDPVDPGHAGQFLPADDDRRARPGFPRINLLSWYLLVIGGLFTLFAMMAGGVDTGWTFYTPYSTTYSNSWVIATALGIFIAGFSSILTGLNFIVTVHRMRAPGMTWLRMPLFVWSHYATSADSGAGHAGAGRHHRAAVLRARLPHRHFRPGAGRRPGAVPAPVLVLLAPRGLHHGAAGHGRGQRDWSPRSRARRIFGYISSCLSSVAIAVLGFLVWGHHLFVARNRCMPAWYSRSSATSWPFPRPSRFSTGPPPCIRARSLRHAHAIRLRLHRAVHHRRSDRPVS
jgi:cytochrome c oxidase subunit 1